MTHDEMNEFLRKCDEIAKREAQNPRVPIALTPVKLSQSVQQNIVGIREWKLRVPDDLCDLTAEELADVVDTTVDVTGFIDTGEPIVDSPTDSPTDDDDDTGEWIPDEFREGGD